MIYRHKLGSGWFFFCGCVLKLPCISTVLHCGLTPPRPIQHVQLVKRSSSSKYQTGSWAPFCPLDSEFVNTRIEIESIKWPFKLERKNKPCSYEKPLVKCLINKHPVIQAIILLQIFSRYKPARSFDTWSVISTILISSTISISFSGWARFILKSVAGCINPLSGFTWRQPPLRYGCASYSEGEGERAAQGEIFIAWSEAAVQR